MVEQMLSRDEAAGYVTRTWFPLSSATLATMATRGGGPAFAKIRGRPVYTLPDLDQWAAARVSRKVTCTAELKEAPHAA